MLQASNMSLQIPCASMRGWGACVCVYALFFSNNRLFYQKYMASKL